MMLSVSIVVPFHDEEKNIEATIGKLNGFFKENRIKGEIVAVNDRSTDKTGNILNSLKQKYKILQVVHRRGNPNRVEIGYAIKDGIKASKSDIVSIVMGDFSDNPNDVLKMVKKIEQGYDIVCGSRFIKGSKLVDYPPLKLVMTKLYNSIFAFMFGLKINDFSNAFKSYRRSVFDKVKLEAKEFEITAEMLLKAHIFGFKITEVPVSWINRKGGESKMGSFSLSFSFIFFKLPRIGLRYGAIALKLYLIYLVVRLSKAFA